MYDPFRTQSSNEKLSRDVNRAFDKLQIDCQKIIDDAFDEMHNELSKSVDKGFKEVLDKLANLAVEKKPFWKFW